MDLNNLYVMKKIKPIVIASVFLALTYLGLFGGISEALNTLKFFSWLVFVIGAVVVLTPKDTLIEMKTDGKFKNKPFSCKIYTWEHWIIAIAFASQGMFWYAFMNLIGVMCYLILKDLAEEEQHERTT